METGSLGKRALETIGFRGAVLVIAFLTGVVTSRLLLPEGRGAFVIGVLTVTLLATLLGNGAAVTYALGQGRSLSFTLGRALLLSSAAGLAGTGLLLPAYLLVVDREYSTAALLAVALPGVLVVQSVGGALLASGSVRAWNVIQLVAPGVALAGMLVLVGALSYGITGAAIAWLVGQGSAAAVALLRTRGAWWPLEFGRSSEVQVADIFFLGLRFGIVSLIGLLNYRLVVFVLESESGLAAVGHYSLAMSLAEMLWVLSSSLATVVVADVIHEKHERAVEVVAQASRHALLVTAAAATIIGLVAVPAIPVVYGEAFRPSTAILLLLLPGAVLWAPISVIWIYFSNRLGRTRYPLAAVATSALLILVLALVLIPRFGSKGAALATTLGYFTGAMLQFVLFAKIAGLRGRELLPRPSDLDAYPRLARSLLRR